MWLKQSLLTMVKFSTSNGRWSHMVFNLCNSIRPLVWLNKCLRTKLSLENCDLSNIATKPLTKRVIDKKSVSCSMIHDFMRWPLKNADEFCIGLSTWERYHESSKGRNFYNLNFKRTPMLDADLKHSKPICSRHLNSVNLLFQYKFSFSRLPCVPPICHHYHVLQFIRHFNCSPTVSSSDDKLLLDSMMDAIKQSHQSGSDVYKKAMLRKPKLKRPAQSKSEKYIKRILPHLFSESGELLPDVTVEKQLLGLMEMWEMEEAVNLLEESVSNGIEPDRTIILNLLQQLANLGEVECLLELHEFLKDRGLSTNLKFYHCLRDAYFNSGRIEEGVLMLRMIYHCNRDFEDTDLFFTLLATMTVRHFEHMLSLIESFVVDLEESDPPITSARDSLWTCFVLAERFDLAEQLLEDHPDTKKKVPTQVTKIIQSQLEVDFDRDVVFLWLINSPYIKSGLAASLFDTLILYKSNQGQWTEGLDHLALAMEEGRKIHPKTVETFLSKFLNQLPEQKISDLSSWAARLTDLSDLEDE